MDAWRLSHLCACVCVCVPAMYNTIPFRLRETIADSFALSSIHCARNGR